MPSKKSSSTTGSAPAKGSRKPKAQTVSAAETTVVVEAPVVSASTSTVETNEEVTNTMPEITTTNPVLSNVVNTRYSRVARTTDLTAEDIFSLTLGDETIGILNDVVQGEDGEWHMPFYNRETRLLEGPAIVVTTDRRRYEKVMWRDFNAHIEDKRHFINLRQMGRGLADAQSYHAFFAGEDILSEFRSAFEDATAVVVFVSKSDPSVIRFVRFDGLKATTLMLDYETNRDVLGNVYITKRFVRRHPIMAKLVADAERWNIKAAEIGLSPIDPETLKTKFEYAAYIAMGFKLIVPAFRETIRTVDAETGEITERRESNEEMAARLQGQVEGKGLGMVAHIVDGFQREVAQVAGLRRDAFTGLIPEETE